MLLCRDRDISPQSINVNVGILQLSTTSGIMTSAVTQPLPPYDLATLLKTPIDQEIPPQALSEILSQPPFLPIPNALNLRTVPLPSSSKITFYRSGPLHHLTPTDATLLSTTYNITKIYDLRSKREREKVPSAVIGGIETIWTPYAVDAGLEEPQTEFIPFEKFCEGEGEEKGKKAWMQIYKANLRSYRAVYKVVFEAVRDWKVSDGGGMLFHCTGMWYPS